MKLLFDHHLSPSLIERLADLFPDSEHVWNVGLHDAPDVVIWSFARERGFTVISKDADFSEISMERGYPPKLLWLRIRNWSTDEIEQLIRARYSVIVDFIQSPDRAILSLFGKSPGNFAKGRA